MFEFNLGCKLDPVAHVSVNERNQTVLIKVAIPLVVSVEIFDVHVAAHDGLRGGDEGTGINQVT